MSMVRVEVSSYSISLLTHQRPHRLTGYNVHRNGGGNLSSYNYVSLTGGFVISVAFVSWISNYIPLTLAFLTILLYHLACTLIISFHAGTSFSHAQQNHGLAPLTSGPALIDSGLGMESHLRTMLTHDPALVPFGPVVVIVGHARGSCDHAMDSHGPALIMFGRALVDLGMCW